MRIESGIPPQPCQKRVSVAVGIIMKQTLGARLVLISLVLLTAATGCGGGGGDDDPVVIEGPSVVFDPSVFNGTYSVAYQLKQNDCPTSAPLQSLNEVYTVTDGIGFRGIPTSEVSANNGLTYTGFSTEGNSDGVTFFTVQGDLHALPNFVPGFECDESISIRFDNSTAPGTRTTFATRTSSIGCRQPDNSIADFGCTVAYEGSGPIQ